MSVGRKVVAGTAFVAAVVTIATGVSGLWSSGERSESSPAKQVRECIAQHGLARASDVQARGRNTTVFSTCVWPAPPWADPDGYSEIIVREDPGPGETEASGVSVADRIDASCTELEVAYSFGKQGDFDRRPPFEVIRGQIVTADEFGELWNGDERALPFYAERNEAVVLRTLSYWLDFVRCVAAR